MFEKMTAGDEGAEEDFEALAVAWTEVGQVWKATAELLESTPGWTVPLAEAIAEASETTGEAATVSGFEEMASAWRKSADSWIQTAEYIQGSTINAKKINEMNAKERAEIQARKRRM